ncbi:hypothetical protein BDFB_012876 [Asbolus verrucosus]|uniref:Uncharacterized protein n=1 Tax=Asbolus verrucosus TaxID=1661398 RepID=A0A482VB82_ASBVE|nr:hypothetical protein BDFB_012876 [Asbolus verrucosus]
MSNMSLFSSAHHPCVVNFTRHRPFVVLLLSWNVAALNYRRNCLDPFVLLFATVSFR